MAFQVRQRGFKSSLRPYLLSIWLWTNYFPSLNSTFFISKLESIGVDGRFVCLSPAASITLLLPLLWRNQFSPSLNHDFTPRGRASGHVTWAEANQCVHHLTSDWLVGGHVTQASPMACPSGLCEPPLFHSLAVVRVGRSPLQSLLLPNESLLARSRAKRNQLWWTTFEPFMMPAMIFHWHKVIHPLSLLKSAWVGYSVPFNGQNSVYKAIVSGNV